MRGTRGRWLGTKRRRGHKRCMEAFPRFVTASTFSIFEVFVWHTDGWKVAVFCSRDFWYLARWQDVRPGWVFHSFPDPNRIMDTE